MAQLHKHDIVTSSDNQKQITMYMYIVNIVYTLELRDN